MTRTELWKRDDGWGSEVTIDGKLIWATHIPMITQPIPNPLTYEYLVMALQAHGYALVCKKEADKNG